MGGRTIELCWDAPTTGPTPEYYNVYRDFAGGLGQQTWKAHSTEITIEDHPYDHRYTVRSVANGIESPDSLPLYRSFAITGIRKVEQNDPDAGTVIIGILVTFATEPGQEYWLDKSTDNGATWHEIGHVLAWANEQSIGGDAASQNAMYRVWQRL